MESSILFMFAGTAIAIAFLMGFFEPSDPPSKNQDSEHVGNVSKVPESVAKVAEALSPVLPKDVISSLEDASAGPVKGHWAKQECERIPACVIKPENSGQVCSAVAALDLEHSRRKESGLIATSDPLFAVRGGGHSAVAGAASVRGGFLIDLSRLNTVRVSDDRESVSVGAGARWRDVSIALDHEGLAAVGGRNSHVGVSGLTLGGGLSFFSPQFGLACSNVVEYEVVLSSGKLVVASATANADLWKALKGGSNNFGIVTRFTLRCFPSTDIWAGFLYMPATQPGKILTAFNQAVARVDPKLPGYEKYAAGPITCFTYLRGLPIQVASIHLAHTNPSQNESDWPTYWKSSGFSSFWRFWSMCKVRSLTDATDELGGLNPDGRRQAQCTTTVKNDAATLQAAHAAYNDAISSIKKVKSISWTLVMQPLVPEWARKGDPNPLGLDEGDSDPLVIVSFTINWVDAKDDAFVRSEMRRALEQIEVSAESRGTAHRYRYLNYCDGWQDPFKGYGDSNKEFLRNVSKKYDPSGLFQTGCSGGFKLWP